MKKVPKRDFEPDEVVFIKNDRQMPKPAKIIIKSSYGTYKIKIYGSKDEEYASQYMIDSYTRDMAQFVGQNSKKNKKLLKYLKMAEKDHEQFLRKLPQIRAVKLCKQEEQEMEDEGNNRMLNNNKLSSKYEAILNLKVENLIQDCRNSSETTFSYNDEGEELFFRESSKDLLIKKLKWGIEDIYLDKANQSTENVISQIINSDIIQPIDYVTTPLFDKIHQVIQYLKKSKKTKLKNYFEQKESLILKGIENHLDNYSVFLRVQDKFQRFLNGEKTVQQQLSNSMQTELRE